MEKFCFLMKSVWFFRERIENINRINDKWFLIEGISSKMINGINCKKLRNIIIYKCI